MAMSGLLTPGWRSQRVTVKPMARLMFPYIWGPVGWLPGTNTVGAFPTANWHLWRPPVTGLYRIAMWGAGAPGYPGGGVGGGSGNFYQADRILAGQQLIRIQPHFGYNNYSGTIPANGLSVNNAPPTFVDLGNGEMLIAYGGGVNPPGGGIAVPQDTLAASDLFIPGSMQIGGVAQPGGGDNGGRVLVGSALGGCGAPGQGPFRGGDGGINGGSRMTGGNPGGGGGTDGTGGANGGNGMVMICLLQSL